ncbi:uncharacterized protein LOC142986386 [Anticarsia gemmatalis]|uniref:uncharacterized protein LOC142986386 n=1 Tax=Anticarsia gemmatalis TaxID=129554 RepID=UPI003F7716C1
MTKVVAVLVAMVLLAVAVESRDWRFESAKRVKRGYNGGFGSDVTFGRSDENASVSREGLNACSGEGDRGYSGSRELGYNRDGRQNDNRRGNRSFSKASASASATASNQNHNFAL